MKTWILRWLPPILMMGLIFLMSSFSSLPGPKVFWWDFILKKSAHMMEYGLLFYFWQRALNWHKQEGQKRYWLSFVIVMLYAISDELHQSLTPGRYPRITDVGFDSLGSFLVYLKLIKLV